MRRGYALMHIFLIKGGCMTYVNDYVYGVTFKGVIFVVVSTTILNTEVCPEKSETYADALYYLKGLPEETLMEFLRTYKELVEYLDIYSIDFEEFYDRLKECEQVDEVTSL